MRSVQAVGIAPELCTDLIVFKESYVLSFVSKTTRLIFVEMCLRVTRIYLCTAFAESKLGLYIAPKLYRPFCRDRRPRRSEKVAFCNALSLSQLR